MSVIFYFLHCVKIYGLTELAKIKDAQETITEE